MSVNSNISIGDIVAQNAGTNIFPVNYFLKNKHETVYTRNRIAIPANRMGKKDIFTAADD